MTSCQKHQNHHCIHSHNCKNLSHKNKKSPSLTHQHPTPSIPLNPTTHNPKKPPQQTPSSQCKFNLTSPHPHSCPSCQQLHKILQNQQIELHTIQKQHLSLKSSLDQYKQQNLQLHAIIQYYRQQINRIIKCNQQDVKFQIKRHLKDNSQLTSKNKFLLNKLNDLQNQFDKLFTCNKQQSKQLLQLKKQKSLISQNYQQILNKYKTITNHNKNTNIQLTQQKKQHNQLTQKYKILLQEQRNNNQQINHKNQKIEQSNNHLIQQLQLLKNKSINQQKLSKLDQQQSHQRQSLLKKKLQLSLNQIQQFKNLINKLQLSLKLKDQELTYSKQLIQKQLQQLKQNKQNYDQTQQQLQSHKYHQKQLHITSKQPSHKNTYRQFKQYNNIPNLDNNQQPYITQLQKQIKQLKQKIVILQGKPHTIYNNQTIQQYILTIGASQAFKRIIQQKNTYIKKLIRQKGALLQQI